MQWAYRSLQTNEPLARAFKSHLEAPAWTFQDVGPSEGIGSTDLVDLGHVTPALPPCLCLGPKDLIGHSTEFVEASAPEGGFEARMTGTEAVAAMALDIVLNPSPYEATREHLQARQSQSPGRVSADRAISALPYHRTDRSRSTPRRSRQQPLNHENDRLLRDRPHVPEASS